MRLLYGTYHHVKPDFPAFNFSGLVEKYPNLYLIPEEFNPQIITSFEERDFDMWYANQLTTVLFNNVMVFLSLLQQAETLYLIIGDDSWSYTLIESFLKFLQARYGITGTLIQNDEDIEYAGETDFNPYYGIKNYDIDQMIYMERLEHYRISQGGEPHVE